MIFVDVFYVFSKVEIPETLFESNAKKKKKPTQNYKKSFRQKLGKNAHNLTPQKSSKEANKTNIQIYYFRKCS